MCEHSLLYNDGFLYFNEDSYYKNFENFFSLDPYSSKHKAEAFMFRTIMEYAYLNLSIQYRYEFPGIQTRILEKTSPMLSWNVRSAHSSCPVASLLTIMR